MIHLDTQIVVWLYYAMQSQLSRRAYQAIGRSRDIRMSPMVEVELEILIEIGRIKPPSAKIMIDRLKAEMGVTLSTATLADLSHRACTFAWTRDPFDRLIVANAMADGARLVTADRVILAHFADAVG